MLPPLQTRRNSAGDDSVRLKLGCCVNDVVLTVKTHSAVIPSRSFERGGSLAWRKMWAEADNDPRLAESRPGNRNHGAGKRRGKCVDTEMRRHDTYCSNFGCMPVTLAVVFASWSAACDGSAEQSFKTGD